MPSIPFYLSFARAGKLPSGYDAGMEERVEARIAMGRNVIQCQPPSGHVLNRTYSRIYL
jgi:hypothetical protein